MPMKTVDFKTTPFGLSKQAWHAMKPNLIRMFINLMEQKQFLLQTAGKSDYYEGTDKALTGLAKEVFTNIPPPYRLDFLQTNDEGTNRLLLHVAVIWKYHNLTKHVLQATPKGKDRLELLELQDAVGNTVITIAENIAANSRQGATSYRKDFELMSWLRRQQVQNQLSKV